MGVLLLAACCPDAPEDLVDEDPETRREALACQADEPEDPAALTRAALVRLSPREEPDPAVRAAAARVLLHIRARGAGPAMAEALSGPRDGRGRGDPHPLVRLEAAASLRGLLGPEAAPALRDGLSDPDRDVRLAVARELGRSGERSGATTDALVQALRDQAPEVRFHARRALSNLHGVDLGLLPEAWESWELQRQSALRGTPGAEQPLEEEDDEPDDERPREER